MFGCVCNTQIEICKIGLKSYISAELLESVYRRDPSCLGFSKYANTIQSRSEILNECRVFRKCNQERDPSCLGFSKYVSTNLRKGSQVLNDYKQK